MTNATIDAGTRVHRHLRPAWLLIGAGARVHRVRRTARTRSRGWGRGRAPAARPVPHRGVVQGGGRPAWLLIGAGAAMVPWMAYLAAALRTVAHAVPWDAVWIGFDALEAAGLVATGLLVRSGDPRRSLTAAATATLFFVDAWFDCWTSAPGAESVQAVLLAAFLELPLAAFLAVIAWRAFPKSSRKES